MTAAYIRNRCYNERLKHTPYFALTGRKPNLSNMRVFGCKCYAYQQDKKKLEPRCRKGIFVGYDRGSPAYLVYFPETGKVMKHRVVRFLEIVSVKEQEVQTDSPLNDDEFIVSRRNAVCDKAPDAQRATEPTGGSSPMNESVSSEASAKTERYSERNRKPPAYLKDYVTSHIDPQDDQVKFNIDYCYRVSAFPQTYREAVESSEAEHWNNAMKEEMDSLTDNDTFTLTTLPEGRESVGDVGYTVSKKVPMVPRTTKLDMLQRVIIR